MAGILETKAQLKRRITMIARFKKNSYQWSPLAMVLIIVLGCVSLPDAKRTNASEISVAKLAHKPNFRKIWIPTKPVSKRSIWVVPVHGKVSPDIAGEPVRLPGTKGAWRWGMSRSADGKCIAYNTLLPSEDHVGICIVPSSGGKVKRIVNRYRAGVSIHNYLLSLSPDGKIVAFTSDEKEKNQLFTLNLEGGDVNQLTMDGGTQPAFSPDGKKIAYVKEKPQKTEIRKSDVWVIPAAGGTPVQVSDLQGMAAGPIWSPDGKMIAFTRRADPGSHYSKEICIVPVSETGNPEASPTQIELPLATLDFLAGWTPDNKIGVHLMNPRQFAIYTIPASGGPATQVTPQGDTFNPRWSPDGERIYFKLEDVIASVPSEGGEISRSPIDADPNFSLSWGGNAVSPDGKKIVFPASKKVFRDNKKYKEFGIYTIPVEGGEPKQLTISPGQDRFPCWSPDGNSIAFIRFSDAFWNEKKHDYIRNIYIVRTEGGEVKQLTSESDKIAWATIAWSPDGKSIAYYSEENTIRVIPLQGGEPRIVVKVNEVSGWSEMDWSRDGKKLAYSSKGSIWVVSLDGGEPEEIKTGLDAKATHLSWSPDGKKIAFTASKGGDTELWLMENFLPAGE
jgi:Tol biopolymer transport system component